MDGSGTVSYPSDASEPGVDAPWIEKVCSLELAASSSSSVTLDALLHPDCADHVRQQKKRYQTC